jgi:hypothetical protein
MHLARCAARSKQLFYVREMLKDIEARRAVVTLMRRGLVTVPEAAALAGVSRQLVRHWCKRARIVIGQSRNTRIANEWRKVINRPD